jgi:hypothetical protein
MKRLSGVIAGLLVLAACADEVPRQEPPAFVEAPPPQGYLGEAIAGEPAADAAATPPGGYTEWIAELRAGLLGAERLAQSERQEALREVQSLYAARHEFLQLYFAEGGAMYSGPGLADAVATSADDFRLLMRELASMEEDAAGLQQALDMARRSLDRIEAEARAAGVPPGAPRVQ